MTQSGDDGRSVRVPEELSFAAVASSPGRLDYLEIRTTYDLLDGSPEPSTIRRFKEKVQSL
jgi:hypothetical protein